MDDYVEEFTDAVVINETPKALAVRFAGAVRWVPKSVIDEESTVESVGDKGNLVLKRWWCEQEGLEP